MTAPATRVLVVCTANRGRSAMAEHLLRRLAAQRGTTLDVSSAGLLTGGHPATQEARAALAERGLDLRHHRSRTLDPTLIAGADLIVTMTREHLRAVAGLAPNAFTRTFTLRELVRRVRAVGPRPDSETTTDWVARLARARSPGDMLAEDPTDDVADPVGRSLAVHRAVADELERLLAEVVQALRPQMA